MAYPNTPSLLTPTNNTHLGFDYTPTFTFKGTDNDGDTLRYTIYFSIHSNFSDTLLSRVSGTNDGFLNTEDAGDTDPFTQNQVISFTLQEADALSSGVYYWRVRTNDLVTGVSSYSSTWSFIIATSYSTTLTEILTFSDTISKTQGFLKSLAETITTSETWAWATGKAITLSETLHINYLFNLFKAGWDESPKHTSIFTNQTKHSANWTEKSKSN